MPIIKNKKSKAAKGVGVTVVSLFKRYNKDKITANGMKKFFIAVFYRLGYMAELTVILSWKRIKKVCYLYYRKAKRIFKEVKIFTDRLLAGILDDLGLPFARIKGAFLYIKRFVKRTRNDASIDTNKEVKQYIAQGVKNNREFIPVIKSYLVPAACFVMMVFVITAGLNQSYAVKIILDGEEIGVIDNYNAFKNADAVIKNKLVTLDGNRTWSTEPEIRITTKLGNDIIDDRQLSDRILQASDEDIVSATGLYVDGEFHGAVENVEKVQQAIDGMLAPYEDGNENKTVSFVQDVSLTEGIFFTDTIVDDTQLAEKITGLVEGEVWYTVQQGDSPLLIASKNGLRLRELYNLNPGLEGGGLWVGDQLLVSQAVPFLQVKEVVTEVRDVETSYKTEQRSNNSMNLGTTKTVQKGEKGLNRETVEVTYVDGIVQSEVVISSEVVKEPVTEIIEVGRYLPSVGVLQNAGSGAFGWPTGGGVRVSRGFAGQYPAHNGVDIAGPYGTPIYASDSGIVTLAKYTNRGYGVYLVIDHGNGYQTLYAHCSSLLVGYGEQVQKGQLIARMGSTGNSTGNHLHFEIKSGNTRYDPYRFW